MALHSTIKYDYLGIVQQLLDLCPDDVLHAENGFEETLLEMVISRKLQPRTGSST